jgi:hypothetical protein
MTKLGGESRDYTKAFFYALVVFLKKVGINQKRINKKYSLRKRLKEMELNQPKNIKPKMKGHKTSP